MSVSASAAGLTGLARANQRLDVFVYVPHVDVHPGYDTLILSQKTMNSRLAGSPRKTTSSHSVAKPEYSIPTSYWSEKNKRSGRRRPAVRASRVLPRVPG